MIPLDLDVVFPAQDYEGECVCQICEERDALGACIDLRAEAHPVFACSTTEEFLDDMFIAELIGHLVGECDDVEELADLLFGEVNAVCGLNDDFNQDEMGIRRFFRPNGDRVCADPERPLSVRLPTPLRDSQHAAFNSSILVRNPGFTAFIDNIAGDVDFSGGNCSTGRCPIAIHRMTFSSPEFDVVTSGGDTIGVTDARFGNLTRGTGECISLAPFSACGFLLDPGTLELVATASDEDGERRMIRLTNTVVGAA